jgi:hypothetical protein
VEHAGPASHRPSHVPSTLSAWESSDTTMLCCSLVRGHAAPVSPLKANISLLILWAYISLYLMYGSPSDRVGVMEPRQLMYPATVGPQFVIANPMSTKQCSALLLRQTIPSTRKTTILNSCAGQTVRCQRTPVTAGVARSLSRSGLRRRRVPHLASYLIPTGPMSQEFPTLITRR